MVHWENHPQAEISKRLCIKGSWRDYAHKIFKPRSTQKPHSLWKFINLHNLLSGALRKPPSRAEFSKRTWFLGRLSLNPLKNHILFGNGLWKAWFENSALRKPPSQAEFSKRKWFLGRLKPEPTQKPHSFWKWALKSQIWKWWFEKTTLRAEFPKRMWFLRRLSLNLLKNHILFGNGLWKVRFENTENGDLRKPPSQAEFSKGTWFLWRLSLNLLKKPRSFWKSALKSPDLKMVHWENHPHKQKSQKEYVIYVYKRFMKIWRDYAHKIL